MNLVTGATGLLGSHLMLALLKRGEVVRGLCRAGSDKEDVRSLFTFLEGSDSLYHKIEWVEGDILDIHSLEDALRGCNRIYHCAAVVSYHRKDRDMMYAVNVEGTANLVNLALKNGGVRLCFVSSIAALGKAKNGSWIDEESEWIDSPLNTHYGISKNLGEMEVWRGIQEGLDAFIVNPGFIIGPGNFDRSSSSIFSKIDEAMGYYPPGGTGFIGVNDAVEAMIKLMDSGIQSERYILVSKNWSMKEIFEKIAEALQKPLPRKEASPVILQIVRMAEFLKEVFTSKKALVTRESVKNASIRFYYHNEKLTKQIPLHFRNLDDSIKETARYYTIRKSGV